MHIYTISNAADRSVLASTATTLLGIATPATRRVKIKEIWASFNSVTATDVPGLLEVVRYTSVGTSTTVTPNPVDSLDPASLCTTCFENCTVEPTGPASLNWTFKLSPIGTTLIYQAPLGDEFEMKVSDFVGLRVTCPQAESGIRLFMKFQE